MSEQRRLISANLDTSIPAFANASWDQIRTACQTGQCRNLWNVGDTKTFTFNNASYTVRIADMTPNRYKYTNENRYTNAVFEYVTILTKELMALSTSNEGGFPASRLKYKFADVNYYYKYDIPPELRARLAFIDTLSLDKTTSTSVATASTQLIIPSLYELTTGSEEAYLNEAPKGQWQYYITHNTTADYIKYSSSGIARDYWLRSAQTLDTYCFQMVQADGTFFGSFASSGDRYIAPCWAW